MAALSDASCAMNVLRAIDVLGTTRVERLDGKTADKLPGRSRVNDELLRQHLSAAGLPDQWKRARPVLEGLGLVEYVGNVGSFLRVRDVTSAMHALEHEMERGARRGVARRARPRKQASPRAAALCGV